jgi:hypothetical protein
MTSVHTRPGLTSRTTALTGEEAALHKEERR